MAWHVYTMPFRSLVMFNFSSMLDIFPPCNPGFVVLNNPCTGIPSRHQDNRAGGLLELESHVSVASSFGLSSGGSRRIFTWSGATVTIILLQFVILDCTKSHLHCTLIVTVSNNGISVAEFAASQR